LNIQGEVAWQLGNISVGPSAQSCWFETEHRDCYVAQLMATYSLPVLDKYKPSVNAAWTYVSVIRTVVKTTTATKSALPRPTRLG